jgi:SAM-dependent methyltransferase
MYRLFHEFAHRYDLHTPPGHYRHDHAFVIREALRVAPANCRLLDIGCGTGVFLEAAIAAGIDAKGIDASPEMVEVARRRLGAERVCIQRMQEISSENAFDAICAISWTIHYCDGDKDLENVLTRCRRALKPGGVLILQIANDELMTGTVNIDREPGPSAEPDDTYFVHQFQRASGPDHPVAAHYVYVSRAHGELLCEEHLLKFANPSLITEAMMKSGFEQLSIINPASMSPFISGIKSNIVDPAMLLGRRQ